MSETAPTVLVERQEALAVITFNRPERRNGVTVEMCGAVHRATQEVAASNARVVILRGAGNDFCVGADIVGGGGDGSSPPTLEDLGRLVDRSLQSLQPPPDGWLRNAEFARGGGQAAGAQYGEKGALIFPVGRCQAHTFHTSRSSSFGNSIRSCLSPSVVHHKRR